MPRYCNLCQKLGTFGNVGGGGKDEKSARIDHARIHFQQLRIASKNDDLSLEKMFERCFLEKMKPRQTRKLAKELIQKYKNAAGKIRCQLCEKEIGVTRRNHLDTDRAVRHALFHLGEPLFRCKRCPKTSATKNGMDHHLRRIHNVSLVGEYEDRSDEFQEEIKDMLTKCYDADKK